MIKKNIKLDNIVIISRNNFGLKIFEEQLELYNRDNPDKKRIEYIALITDNDKNITKTYENKLCLATIHKIKGCEWSYVFLIDLDDNSIRRFEPYGISNVNNENDLDDYIIDNMKDILGKKFKYYRPSEYLDYTRFQAVSNDGDSYYKKAGDPGGYCLAWCFWYIELKLNNPNIDKHGLVRLYHRYISKENSKIHEPLFSKILDLNPNIKF